MEELERKIREHRDEFDAVEEPRIEVLWERIRNLEPAVPAENPASNGWKIHIGKNWRWTIAAAIALALSVLLAWPKPAPEKRGDYRLADFYPELADQEQAYRQLVAAKEKAIGLTTIDPSDYRQIFDELALLDELQAQSLRDLPKYFDNEQLVQTLIKNYEQRIRILERLALEIDKNKQHEERNQKEDRRI